MNLTIEQKKEILDNAPTGATHIETKYRGHPYCKASNGELTDIYLDEWCSILPVKSISLIALEDLLADVIAHEATEEEMKNIDSILVESDEILATEMSERDIPSFDDPIFVSPLDACASNEVDFETEANQVEQLTSKAEWKNGCKLYYPDGIESIFIGMDGDYPVVKTWCDKFERFNIYVECEYILSTEKPESPEQKAKRDREERIEELRSLVSTGSIHDDFEVKWAIEKLYDAGYFK